MSNYDPFDPGWHQLLSNTSGLVLEYVVYRSNRGSTADARRNFILAQCPGWGITSGYLQQGLSDLWAPSSTRANHTENPTSYTVVFFHPRGTGESLRPVVAPKMSSMDMAGDIEDLRKYLAVEQFPVLLGHANGGAIGLNYAEMYPDRVQKLILIAHQIIGRQDRQTDKLAATRDNPAYRGAWDKVPIWRPQTDEELTDMVNAIWPLYFYDPEKYTDEILRAIGDQQMSAWTYRWQTHCDQNVEDQDQMADGLKFVRAKTLVIRGQDDMIIGPKIARWTMEIPGAELITYEECGHFPWIEKKVETMRDIRRFIEGGER